jgi:3-isopropylmalate dehydrogenase
MATHRIAVLPGDGIGPEVVRVGVRVLEALARKRSYTLELVHLDLGADRYLRDGTTFPAEVAEDIRERCDAVLLGALGDPRVADLKHARDILFGLRFGLDLYCNVRPVVCLHDRLMPLKGRSASDCNFVVFRENTEGIYANVGGQFKRGTPDEVAINEDINTRKGVERVIRAAFAYARAHGKKRVHMADKSNAMQHAHELWLRVFREVSGEYKDIEARHVYVDALCLFVVQDPSQFEVVVTNNLFGDIVTDLGAGLQGGLGMAASANVRPKLAGEKPVPGLFEPVHGSAPPLAGKDVANPLATVLTVGMMLAHLGHPEDEALLVQVVRDAIDQRMCTADVGGSLGTQATGDFVLQAIERQP